MRRLTQPHDSPISILATDLAETVAEAMDQAGVALTLVNTMALTSALNKAIEHVARDRERAERQCRIERRAAWVHEQSLLTAAETAQRLELTLQELEMARELTLIVPVEVPLSLQATSAYFTPQSWRYYRPGITLTKADRMCIAHETLLTRAQAAERLGVSLPAFDRLRVESGLSAVEQASGRGGSQPHLYRTEAVDRLAAIAGTSETHRGLNDSAIS